MYKSNTTSTYFFSLFGLISEFIWLSGVFRDYKMEHWAKIG